MAKSVVFGSTLAGTFDSWVVNVGKAGNGLWLSWYRSRTDMLPWEHVVASPLYKYLPPERLHVLSDCTNTPRYAAAMHFDGL